MAVGIRRPSVSLIVSASPVPGSGRRGSTVAGKLGLEKERPQRGEFSFLFGYWRGIPDNGYMTLAVATNYDDRLRCSLDVVGI